MVNQNFFDVIDTPEKAYWIGFIYADGSIQNNSNTGNYSLTVGLKYGDKEHITTLEIDLGGDREATESRLSWYSKHMVGKLIKHGITPAKSQHNIPVPKIKKLLLSHFWRGVFDGDGMISTCVKKKQPLPEYRFSLAGSSHCLESFQKWTAQFGIRRQKIVVAKNSDGPTKAFKIEMSGNRQIECLMDNLYVNAKRCLPRKYELYQALKEQNAAINSSFPKKYLVA